VFSIANIIWDILLYKNENSNYLRKRKKDMKGFKNELTDNYSGDEFY